MKKISILSLHLGYGGIEKCITSLANNLVNNYEVEIISTYKLYDKSFYDLNNKVKIKYLTTNINPNKIKEEFKKTNNFFKKIILGIKSIRILRLKKKLNINAIKLCNSDIIISTRDYFNHLVGKYFKNEKIAWEHNHHHGDIKYINNLCNSVKNIDKLILVSEPLKDDYTKIFKERNIKCQCLFIPNFIDKIPNELSKLNNNNILSVGRLEHIKGYSDLIQTMKLVNKDIHLDIIGDGSLKKDLYKQIDDNKVNIKLHGYQNKDYINNYYLNSTIYIMTSISESFGLVLIEAMSYGLPCIAFDTAEGAKYLIQNDYNGYLIKNRDKKQLAKKIEELLNDKHLLKKLSEGARNTAIKYQASEIIKLWIELIGD